MDKYRKAEENKKLKDEEMEQQRLLKIQREHEKEQRLKNVKHFLFKGIYEKKVLTEYQMHTETRNDFFLKTLNQEQMRVAITLIYMNKIFLRRKDKKKNYLRALRENILLICSEWRMLRRTTEDWKN